MEISSEYLALCVIAGCLYEHQIIHQEPAIHREVLFKGHLPCHSKMFFFSKQSHYVFIMGCFLDSDHFIVYYRIDFSHFQKD